MTWGSWEPSPQAAIKGQCFSNQQRQPAMTVDQHTRYILVDQQINTPFIDKPSCYRFDLLLETSEKWLNTNYTQLSRMSCCCPGTERETSRSLFYWKRLAFQLQQCCLGMSLHRSTYSTYWRWIKWWAMMQKRKKNWQMHRYIFWSCKQLWPSITRSADFVGLFLSHSAIISVLIYLLCLCRCVHLLYRKWLFVPGCFCSDMSSCWFFLRKYRNLCSQCSFGSARVGGQSFQSVMQIYKSEHNKTDKTTTHVLLAIGGSVLTVRF